MIKAFKYRLYPTKTQTDFIIKSFRCSRYVYNWALNKRLESYKSSGKIQSRYELQKELTCLKKKEETNWLNEAIAQALQVELFNLDNAYKRFFKENRGFPRFKSRNNKQQSFSLPQGVKVDFDKNRIIIPKIGEVKCRFSRRFIGSIKTVTISNTNTNKYFISILVEDGKPACKPKPITNESIGIVIGSQTLITCSDGRSFENPKYLMNSIKKIELLNKQLSKKKLKSNNRLKLLYKLSAIYEKTNNQRLDCFHKASHQVANKVISSVFIEDINAGEKTASKEKSTNAPNVGIGLFYRILEYKCKWKGINFVRVSRYESTVKICACGQKINLSKLSDKPWMCPMCGKIHIKDLIAANDIRLFGHLQYSGGVPAVEPVELPALPGAMKQESIHNYGSTIN